MLKNNLVVFPTSRAIREFVKSQQQNILLEKHITIGDLFDRVVLQKENKTLCDKNLKILFLQKAIKNIDITKLGLNKNFSTFINQSDYIFRFFSELNSEYITIEKLLEFDTYALYEEHLVVLQQIYTNYKKLLDTSIYSDNIFLPLEYKININYIKEFSSITIYLEGYLSKFEQEIIKQIAQHKQTNIKIVFNKYNQKNKNIFDKLTLEDNISYTIDISSNTIVDKTPLNTPNQTIEISPIESSLTQIPFIKYQITSMVKHGIDPNKIAVLLPDESFASTLELFDDEHYFNFAMGRSIKDNKIVKVVEFISKVLVDEEPLDKIKYNFLKIDDKIFNTIKTYWHKDITTELFDDILSWLFLYETDEDILEKLDNLKLYLQNLIFTKNSSLHFSLKLKEFFKITLNELLKITIDDTKGGKVTVLGILETRLVEFDGIIIVDFNDNKIPKISIKDKFLSSHLKELVSLPSLEDRYNLQRYYYKRFLDKAKYISIGYIDDESSVISRFVTQLYPNYKNYIVKKSYSSILYNKFETEHFYKDIILDIDLSKTTWSATRLATYLRCKRAYYFKYILNIKNHFISLKPQSFELGSIIHDTLEKAVKEQNLTSNFINTNFARYSKQNPYLTLELEIWKKRLESFINLEKTRKNNNITIFKVEEPFEKIYQDIKLIGKIDRIDKYPDDTFEILDYKTSSTLKIDTIKTYESSTDFQLEFYYLALKDRFDINNVAYYDLYNCKIKSEDTLKQKLDMLDIYLKSLKTTKVNFTLTDEIKNCTYCNYKTICKRD